jgi:DNA-binding transcriptional LysR family regulator
MQAVATIGTTGSFAAAAMRLNVSQPALSRQIDALEYELGLAEPVGRGVRLTRRARTYSGNATACSQRSTPSATAHDC